jgi:small subunit ribosomal protein S24e
MEFEVTRDTRNELLKRREVDFELRFEGPTPSRMQVTGKLAALMNVGENTIVLDTMKTRFGIMELTGSARIYDNEEDRNKVERGYLLARGIPKPKEEEGA